MGEAEALAARPLETDPPGTPPAGLVDRPGLYRFELKSSGSPGCETYERRPSSRPPGSACIAVTSIQKTTAQYVSEGERHSGQYSWGYSWTQIDTVSEATAAVIASNRRAHIKQTDGQKFPNGARDFYCPAVPELPLHLQIIPPAL